jgi:hypothetical protein
MAGEVVASEEVWALDSEEGPSGGEICPPCGLMPVWSMKDNTCLLKTLAAFRVFTTHLSHLTNEEMPAIGGIDNGLL